MYEIDYVFDEMSLFHIEELFDISILSSPPNSVASSNKLTQENLKQTGRRKLGELNYGAQIPAALLMQDTKWTLPSAEVNFMLNDLKKKYGENTSLISWYFLKYTVGSSAIEHMHKAFNGEYKGWSTITMLSNPSEYMGGELVIHTRDKEEEIVLKKGQTIRINDDVVHSVNRVDWGERRTLIHWFKE